MLPENIIDYTEDLVEFAVTQLEKLSLTLVDLPLDRFELEFREILLGLHRGPSQFIQDINGIFRHPRYEVIADRFYAVDGIDLSEELFNIQQGVKQECLI